MPGTLTDRPAESIPVPYFRYADSQPMGWRHRAGIAFASLIAHLVLALLATGLSSLPSPQRRTAPAIRLESRPRSVTQLVAPRFDVLTQRDPNRGKISQEFNVASLPPRPDQPNVPVSPGAAAAPRQKFHLPDRRAPDPIKPLMPEAPAPSAVDTAQLRNTTPPPMLGTPVAAPPPPQIQPVEKPKLAFEKPGATTGTTTGMGRIQVQKPTGTVEEAARQVVRGGGKGLVVGDEDDAPGANPSSPSVPIPGRIGSAVELLSDPDGVDFRPYLVQILTTIRRNWRSIIPESARIGGRQGRTTIQFALDRAGTVVKLVIATPSGIESLDRAAVSGISMSNPLPPLPPDFRGTQVRLQFVFKYNVK